MTINKTTMMPILHNWMTDNTKIKHQFANKIIWSSNHRNFIFLITAQRTQLALQHVFFTSKSFDGKEYFFWFCYFVFFWNLYLSIIIGKE